MPEHTHHENFLFSWCLGLALGFDGLMPWPGLHWGWCQRRNR